MDLGLKIDLARDFAVKVGIFNHLLQSFVVCADDVKEFQHVNYICLIIWCKRPWDVSTGLSLV